MVNVLLTGSDKQKTDDGKVRFWIFDCSSDAERSASGGRWSCSRASASVMCDDVARRYN